MGTKRESAKCCYNRRKILSEVKLILRKKGFETDVYMDQGYFLIKVKDPDAKHKRMFWFLPGRTPRRTLARVNPFPKTWVFQVFDEKDFSVVRRLANTLSLAFGFRHNLPTRMNQVLEEID